MIANKEVMARNIKKYMDLLQVNATDVCRTLKIKQNTFSDWVNAKTYPRIDKIEAMANYFGIRKTDLVEDSKMSDIEVTLSNDEKILVELYRKEPSFRQLLQLSKYAEELRKGNIDNEN